VWVGGPTPVVSIAQNCQLGELVTSDRGRRRARAKSALYGLTCGYGGLGPHRIR
jgi:hypothetical protein